MFYLYFDELISNAFRDHEVDRDFFVTCSSNYYGLIDIKYHRIVIQKTTISAKSRKLKDVWRCIGDDDGTVTLVKK